jgi:hypothetical protein
MIMLKQLGVLFFICLQESVYCTYNNELRYVKGGQVRRNDAEKQSFLKNAKDPIL